MVHPLLRNISAVQVVSALLNSSPYGVELFLTYRVPPLPRCEAVLVARNNLVLYGIFHRLGERNSKGYTTYIYC